MTADQFGELARRLDAIDGRLGGVELRLDAIIGHLQIGGEQANLRYVEAAVEAAMSRRR